MNIEAATHLPLLVKALDISGNGDVLELGMGLYSTPVMHWICGFQGRKLFSYDSDKHWYDTNKKWENGWHKVDIVENWEALDLSNKHWSVVLVDNKPAGERKQCLRKLVNNANFIVVHDTEPEQDMYFKYSWIYPLFKYRYDDKKYIPNTSILSNFINLQEILK